MMMMMISSTCNDIDYNRSLAEIYLLYSQIYNAHRKLVKELTVDVSNKFLIEQCCLEFSVLREILSQKLVKLASVTNIGYSWGYAPPSSLNSQNNVFYGNLPHSIATDISSDQQPTNLLKFGCFGVDLHEFAEPSDLAATRNHIIVMDSITHTAKMFDRSGKFCFMMADYGKNEGQLTYPVCVGVNKRDGHIIIGERHPASRVQVFDKKGKFLYRFGVERLVNPVCIDIDNSNRIVMIDGWTKQLMIFQQSGKQIKSVDLRDELRHPSSLCCSISDAKSDTNPEIFICDISGNYVKIFDYDGKPRGRLGGTGQTNRPIKVAIRGKEEVLVFSGTSSLHVAAFNIKTRKLVGVQLFKGCTQFLDVELINDDEILVSSSDCSICSYQLSLVPS